MLAASPHRWWHLALATWPMATMWARLWLVAYIVGLSHLATVRRPGNLAIDRVA